MGDQQEIADLVVLGLGYIGLPTAALFAQAGLRVVGVDTDPNVVQSVAKGTTHLDEDGLAELVQSVVCDGSLEAATAPVPASTYVIAVPTPLTPQNSADTSLVESALDAIAPHIGPGATVIVESTCPVGTTQALSERLAAWRPDLTIGDGTTSSVSFAYCPERVLPGNILNELKHNERVVGGLTPLCSERAATRYKLIVDGRCHLTDAATAELVKLAENAFRDLNIAYANELAGVADGHNVNAWEVIRLANEHPRVNILSPGPGVGGHCIAIDPWFIVQSSTHPTPLIRAARSVNLARPQSVVDRVEALAVQFQLTSIGCLGVSYKADVADLRESPALAIVSQLAQNYDVTVVEPHLTELPAQVAVQASLASLDEALESCEIIVVLVAHSEFGASTEDVRRHPLVVDVVGLLEPDRSATP